jgi:hypothetical protein
MMFLVVSCQQNAHREIFIAQQIQAADIPAPVVQTANKGGTNGTCNPDAYTITLESKTLVNGNWEWVWSVQNPNPGNGSNGTVQNLSHWGMQLGSCIDFSTIIGGATSPDGVKWTSFVPTYRSDASQGCMGAPVVKFDYGTSASDKSYYKLIVDRDLQQGLVPGYYKSGSVTSCCTILFMGFACGAPQEVNE